MVEEFIEDIFNLKTDEDIEKFKIKNTFLLNEIDKYPDKFFAIQDNFQDVCFNEKSRELIEEMRRKRIIIKSNNSDEDNFISFKDLLYNIYFLIVNYDIEEYEIKRGDIISVITSNRNSYNNKFYFEYGHKKSYYEYFYRFRSKKIKIIRENELRELSFLLDKLEIYNNVYTQNKLSNLISFNKCINNHIIKAKNKLENLNIINQLSREGVFSNTKMVMSIYAFEYLFSILENIENGVMIDCGEFSIPKYCLTLKITDEFINSIISDQKGSIYRIKIKYSSNYTYEANKLKIENCIKRLKSLLPFQAAIRDFNLDESIVKANITTIENLKDIYIDNKIIEKRLTYINLKFYKETENKRNKTFDFIFLSFSVTNKETAKKFLDMYRTQIFKYALDTLQSKNAFLRYNIPINFLKIYKATLTQDGLLIIQLCLKDELITN